MNETVKNGMIIVAIYVVILIYLFFASYRIERLEQSFKAEEETVVLNASE